MFEVLWELSKCDRETRSEQLLENWCQQIFQHRVATGFAQWLGSNPSACSAGDVGDTGLTSGQEDPLDK